MIFKNNVFTIYVDGVFAGITEDEDYIWDIAQNDINGFKDPLTDDNFCERVEVNKINVNRFYRNGKHVIDKLEPTNSILCYNSYEAQNATNKLNGVNLTTEKVRAKIRAMKL